MIIPETFPGYYGISEERPLSKERWEKHCRQRKHHYQRYEAKNMDYMFYVCVCLQAIKFY